MDAIKNLLSEHGLFGILLIIGAIVLTAFGKMTVDDFKGYSEWIFTVWGGTHSAVALSDAIATKGAASSAPAQQVTNNISAS